MLLNNSYSFFYTLLKQIIVLLNVFMTLFQIRAVEVSRYKTKEGKTKVILGNHKNLSSQYHFKMLKC